MSLWLNKKKKPELVALCEQLDLETVGYRKTELEAILAEYLDSHESELASDSTFSSYYDSLHSRSPVKGASAAAIALDVSEKRTRRTPRRYGTASLEEVSTAEDSTPEPSTIERKTRSGSRPLSTRTPRTVRSLRQAAAVPLPPSPAVVAADIDLREHALVNSMKERLEKAQVQERAAGVRDALSNVVSVNALSLALELVYLFATLIPRTYEVAVPAIAALGTEARIVVVPDLFVLLTSAFWSPFLTWLAMSFVGPLANAVLFNMVATNIRADETTSAYRVDPLTFAVTKTLVAWLVYYKQFDFWGMLGNGSIQTVEDSVGKELQLVTAGVGGIAAIWEAILRKR